MPVAADVPTVLVDQHADRRQLRAIALASLVLCVLAFVAFPHAGHPLLPAPSVAGIFGSLVGVSDLLIFFLLATRPGHASSPAIRMIACAYLYGGLMALLHVATFPGAVLPGEPLVGQHETVGWLFLCWRFGFSLLLLSGVILGALRPASHEAAGPVDTEARRSSRKIFGRSLAMTVAAVAACFLLALWLPTLNLPVHAINTSNGAFGTWPLLASWAAAVFCAIAVVVILLTRRMHRTLYLWIGFVLLANGLGLALSESGGARYTLGWYSARAYAILASGVVLGLLVNEVMRLQRSLAWSASQLGQQAQSLQAEIHRRAAAEKRLIQAQRLEVMGQIAGGIAHDFNNHMQVISARLALLRRRSADLAVPGVEEDINVMTRTLRRAEELTRRLLSASGRRTLQPQRLSFFEWLPPFSEMLRTMVGKARIEVRCEPDTWAVLVDPGELESALVNLVANARDALPDAQTHAEAGLIRISVRNHAISPQLPVPCVEIAVQDNGAGISADILPRVFEPFFSTKTVDKGTGLGLSQVLAFAGHSQGAVDIDSETGRGTTVSLYLPRAEHAVEDDRQQPSPRRTAEALVPAAAAAERDAGAKGATVLVVDDNEDLLQSTGALLSQMGFVVHYARSGEDALDQLQRQGLRPRVVLSDIVMPGSTSGLDLARELRRKHPEITVVLSTAYSRSAAETLAEGFMMLTKPYEPEALEKQIVLAMGTVTARGA